MPECVARESSFFVAPARKEFESHVLSWRKKKGAFTSLGEAAAAGVCGKFAQSVDLHTPLAERS